MSLRDYSGILKRSLRNKLCFKVTNDQKSFKTFFATMLGIHFILTTSRLTVLVGFGIFKQK